MQTNKTLPVFQDDDVTIFKCEDLWYENHKGKYFVLEKSNGYGFFQPCVKAFTKGEIVDKFGILILE